MKAAKGAGDRRGLKFAALVVFIVSAFLFIRYSGLSAYLDQDKLRRWIDGFGHWGPAVYILIYCLAPSLMAPGLPLTVMGGVLFGPLWGTVYALTGATVGASIAFLVARYMGRSWVERFLSEGSLRELDDKVREQGWKIVAFTRLVPLFPFNFLNYAFGLTSVRFGQYALASFIFMAPGTAAYVIFSSSILDIFKGRVSWEFVAGAALVVLVSLLPFLYKRFKGRKGH